MPELPDIIAYLGALRPRIVGRLVTRFRVVSPFVLRTFDPPAEAVVGRRVESVERLGKRFVFSFDDDLLIVTHLMIAGRWRWSERPEATAQAKVTLASLVFDQGTLHLVESSQKKRASIHVVRGREALGAFDRGGLDVQTCSFAAFAAALRRENHTVKRSLADPRLVDGVGNAYSDEILHAARLSPIKLTAALSDEELRRLFEAARTVLDRWIDRLRDRFRDKFPGPGEITAFRPEFAVHGKFGKPCPVCRTVVQRIRYAENDTNYCPRCQTEGVILADRSMSRLLKKDWPRTVEEWERANSADCAS